MTDEKPSLFWSKVWYFTTFGTSGLLYPLLNIFFRSKGLSESQIGVIAALRPWSSALSGNVWAFVGDSSGRYKTILFTAHVCAVICRYCIGLANSFPVTLVFVVLSEAMTAPLQILADASSMAAGTTEGQYGKARLWGAVGWGLFSPLSGVITSRLGSAASFDANLIGGVFALLPTILLPTEALARKKLGKGRPGGGLDGVAVAEAPTPRSEDGSQPPDNRRSEDSIGSELYDDHLSASLLPSRGPNSKIRRGDSLLFEVADGIPLAPTPELIDYDSWAHLHRVSSGSPDALPAAEPGDPSEASPRASVPGHRNSRDSAQPEDPTLRQKVMLLFTSPDILVFFAMATLFGFAAGNIDGFLFLYLEDLGAPKVLMGLTITVACVVELPVFHYMGQILKFVGVTEMLQWVMFFFLVRLGCYTLLGFLPSPWMVLPVEMLNGITFGCAWAAGTVHCSRIAPLGLEATTQSIYTGLYAGLGLGGGGLFGGFVYANFGPRWTFLAAFAVLAFGWALILLAQSIMRCVRARKHTDLLEPLAN